MVSKNSLYFWTDSMISRPTSVYEGGASISIAPEEKVPLVYEEEDVAIIFFANSRASSRSALSG